jgi:hypothetical protein
VLLLSEAIHASCDALDWYKGLMLVLLSLSCGIREHTMLASVLPHGATHKHYKQPKQQWQWGYAIEGG